MLSILITYSYNVYFMTTSKKHNDYANLPTTENRFKIKAIYFYLYFVHCVQYHNWYSNYFFKGVNTRCFTVLRECTKSSAIKTKVDHLKINSWYTTIIEMLSIYGKNRQIIGNYDVRKFYWHCTHTHMQTRTFNC